jgi:hypothetical protein
MKKNENDASPAGFASLDSTPGMGDVVMPTETSIGSGDLFGGVMNFGRWKSKRRKKRSKKRRS